MNESPGNGKEKELLDEIRHLTEPRSPSHLIQDASGLFTPGFMALPAVTIVGAKPPRTEIRPEKFVTGQLYAFTAEKSAASDWRDFLTFFTPIENIEIPPVQFLVPPARSRNISSLQAESKSGWKGTELYFAWLPWGTESVDQFAKLQSFLRIPDLARTLVANLEVFLAVNDREIRLEPLWGLDTWLPSPSAESIIFPVNYARRLIEPFIFRLRLSETFDLPDGKKIHVGQRSLKLNFKFPGEVLERLCSMAGLGPQAMDGFHVVGNAVPMMNVDMKAWEPDVTYGEFIKTTSMRPLGFAGVVSFKKSSEFLAAGRKSGGQAVLHLPHSTQLSMEFNADGKLISRYGLPDSIVDSREGQLLFWMTYGEEVNGLTLKYTDAEKIQPMQVRTQSLKQAVTLLPCFGGFNCRSAVEDDMYSSLMLNYSAPPQMLMFRDSLLFTVRDLLTRLGYGDHKVHGPFVELRVLGGIRQRVSVVYIDDNISNPLKTERVAVIQSYLDQRAPIGSRILLEVRKK